MTDKGRPITQQLTDQLEGIIEQMCDKYCKYRDEYLARYSDLDIAHEIMLEEKCVDCPLSRI